MARRQGIRTATSVAVASSMYAAVLWLESGDTKLDGAVVKIFLFYCA